MRSLVAFVTLFALLAGVAGAADDVSIGMVRLPTPVFIGLDQGYFAAEGLNVTPVFSQNGAEIVPALATGKIDIALASPGAALFNALAIGVDAKIVADCWVAPRTKGSNDYAFIDVRKDLAANGNFKARDAKGLTFAITAHGQMTELFATAYLQSAGPSIYEETGLPAGLADLSVDIDGPFALRWQMTQYVNQGLVKTTPDLKAAVDNGFVRAAR